ncbi:MAG: NAD(P)/FAD-dependent oxidoreductase [Longimicrobiales bacterium]
MMQDEHVVIVGGGFGGINLAGELAGKGGVRVTLVDRNNYNFFQPLLYQVATGQLEVSSIALPFRTILKGSRNVRFRLGELVRVDPEARVVHLSTGTLEYDYLVLATGTETNFFGMDSVEEDALPMKTLEEGLALRNHLLRKTEEATFAATPDERARLLTVVISGAGPTGVELAGMLAEMRRDLLEKIYPELDRGEVEVVLVDAAPSVLPPMRDASQRYTLDVLSRMGVGVLLNTRVEGYRDGAVQLADGSSIPTATLIWAAGVRGRAIDGIPRSSYGRGERLRVDAFGQVAGVPDVFAIGDASLQTSDDRFPHGHPQLASVAAQQGRHLAVNLLARVHGEPLRPFRYVDRGSMAIIGRSKAAADLTVPRRSVTGWAAWAMWLFVHLFQLIGYRNRLSTMWDWTTAYFMRDRSLGMILRAAEGDRMS